MVTVYLLLVLIFCEGWAKQGKDFDHIRHLIIQWAPLIWFSPGEDYFPSSAEDFLKNVHLTDEKEHFRYSHLDEVNFSYKDTQSMFLVTKRNLLDELNSEKSFLNGVNLKRVQVPIYALVSHCAPSYNTFRSSNANRIKSERNNLHFQVTYWIFYPYNRGKEICFLGKVPTPMIFGTCFGRLKTIGSHVGDWEHVTLSFRGKPSPSDMYLSVHDTGSYYKFDDNRKSFVYDPQRVGAKRVQKPKFPPMVKMQMGHPVLFAANGSHGLWSSPGDHEYVRIPHLTDVCGYGVPWKTWENVEIFNLGFDELPKWMLFRGKWGNPMSNCVLSSKIGLCEHADGPKGILRKKQEFYC